ncbi:MAG: PIN domain-containing protein [Candidatus Methanoperedens sp.]|nr:PIN domain-containing protein [Candidatus Methanoperedens sp.]
MKRRSHYSMSDIFVTDTHALLWYLTDDEKLSKIAQGVFEKADKGEVDIVIPTTVLAEALFITEKHRVDIEFIDIIENIQNSSNYLLHPLDIDIVMKCHELKKIPELHDRIIVATAILLDAKLITKDTKIKVSKEVEVVW